MNKDSKKYHKAIVVLVLSLSLFFYYLLSYKTQRLQFLQVAVLFSLLFAGYFFLLQKTISVKYFFLLLAAGFVYRFSLLFSVPNLSDDVYRFIWDGKLSAAGINPFNFLPSESLTHTAVDGITPELYSLLNSKEYYTIYPPVMQWVFMVGGIIFQSIFTTTIFFKSILLVADCFNFYFLIILLKHFKKPVGAAFIYFLNPLVIIEFTGNVHFEALMFFFLLAAAVLLVKNRFYLSSILFGLSISTKLLPVIFLPLVVSVLGWKKGLLYSFISGLVTIFLFSFWIDSTTIQNFLTSVDLFFQRFEFNASLYYVVRGIGHSVIGYNIIQWTGPVLMLLATGLIFLVSFKMKKSQQAYFNTALFVIVVFFLFSTTVHPWYVTLPLLLSVFTGFTFPILWSFAAVFSYHAYSTVPVKENLLLVAICYSFVFLWAMAEWFYHNKFKKPLTDVIFDLV